MGNVKKKTDQHNKISNRFDKGKVKLLITEIVLASIMVLMIFVPHYRWDYADDEMTSTSIFNLLTLAFGYKLSGAVEGFVFNFNMLNMICLILIIVTLIVSIKRIKYSAERRDKVYKIFYIIELPIIIFICLIQKYTLTSETLTDEIQKGYIFVGAVITIICSLIFAVLDIIDLNWTKIKK